MYSFSFKSDLFIPSGLSDGGGLDDGLITAFDENPVACWDSIHFNLVPLKYISFEETYSSCLSNFPDAQRDESVTAYLATEIQSRPTVHTCESSSSSRV